MRRSNQQMRQIHVRIDAEFTKSTERIFAALGFSTTEAIPLLLQQVEMHNDLPFDLTIPSKKALAAMEEATARKAAALWLLP